MRGKPRLIKLADKDGKLKSPFWYIGYYEGRDRRRSTGCIIGAQDHEANLALSAFTLEREKPTAREPDKLMVAQALQDYYNEHAQYLESSGNAKRSIAKLRDYFGPRMVLHVTQSIVNQYVRQEKARKQSNGTIRRDLQILSCAFNHEVREQRLTYAPKFKLPPSPAPRDRYLTQEEIDLLYDACDHERTKNFIKLMLHTGQRPGAVEQLTWFQVDFSEAMIHFDRDGKEQTNKRKAAVPMTDEIYDLLTELYDKKETGYVLGHPGKARRAMENAYKKAGIERAGRYTLRHTALDRLGEVADERTTSDIGGHTSTLTTRKHYRKSKIERQRKALNKMWPTTQLQRKSKNDKL